MKILNRHKDTIPEDSIYVGRGTPYGNPYIIGEHGTRSQVIELYRTYMDDKITQRDPIVIKAFKALHKDSILVCSCSPAPCHAEVIEELWNTHFNMGNVNPNEDGVTHINIYSKGKTELGRLLTNFAEVKIDHPNYGTFRTLEGFWHWVKTGKKHDVFRTCNSLEAKHKAKEYDAIYDENFQQEIKTAVLLKIESSDKIRQLLKECTLPLVHYYWYGDSDSYKVVVPTNSKWLIDYIDLVREYLRGNAHKLIIAGSRKIDNLPLVKKLYDSLDIKVVQIVSGHATKGVDLNGEAVAKLYQIPVKIMPANWDALGNSAGHMRNLDMSKYGTYLLAVWDGVSPGTLSMIKYMQKEKKGYKVYTVKDDEVSSRF